VGLSGVSAIATSGSAAHALALKRDGTVVARGVNTNGQATPPGRFGRGGRHTRRAGSTLVALKADGSVATWGSDANGQLNIPVALPRGYALAASSRTSFLINGPTST